MADLAVLDKGFVGAVLIPYAIRCKGEMCREDEWGRGVGKEQSGRAILARPKLTCAAR
jgi:hypothetical protein